MDSELRSLSDVYYEALKLSVRHPEILMPRKRYVPESFSLLLIENEVEYCFFKFRLHAETTFSIDPKVKVPPHLQSAFSDLCDLAFRAMRGVASGAYDSPREDPGIREGTQEGQPT